jgi:hypothetical protein
MLTYTHLSRFPRVCLALTGLHLTEFDELVEAILSLNSAVERKCLSRPQRQRRIGGGRLFELSLGNRLLLTVVWLRHYPPHEVLEF